MYKRCCTVGMSGQRTVKDAVNVRMCDEFFVEPHPDGRPDEALQAAVGGPVKLVSDGSIGPARRFQLSVVMLQHMQHRIP